MFMAVQLRGSMERKCGEIEKRLADYSRRIALDRNAVMHVRATIAFFELEAGRRVNVPVLSIARLFERGEIFALCVRAFGELGSQLDTKELTAFCLKAKGFGTVDPMLRRSMAQTLCEVMRMRRDKGEVVEVGRRRTHGAPIVWTLSRQDRHNRDRA